MINVADLPPTPERNERGEFLVPPAAEKRATVLSSALEVLSSNTRVRGLRGESVAQVATTEIAPEQLEQRKQAERSAAPEEEIAVPPSISSVETEHRITTDDVVDLAEYAKRLAGQNESIHPLVRVDQPTQRGLYDQEAA